MMTNIHHVSENDAKYLEELAKKLRKEATSIENGDDVTDEEKNEASGLRMLAGAIETAIKVSTSDYRPNIEYAIFCYKTINEEIDSLQEQWDEMTWRERIDGAGCEIEKMHMLREALFVMNDITE